LCHSRANGNPDAFSEKAGNHRIKTPGFLLEFIPMEIGAGMTILRIPCLKLF
jgi:hypothetical protein